jgi:hypothetical protein
MGDLLGRESGGVIVQGMGDASIGEELANSLERHNTSFVKLH